MRLQGSRDGDVVILECTGEFDASDLAAFTAEVDRMIGAGDNQFVLDLRLLKFINSAALGYLIKTRKNLADAGGGMVLARPSKFVRKTLSTLGLDDIFQMFDSVEGGVMHFRTGKDIGEIKLEDGEYDQALTGSVPILFRPTGDGGDTPNQVGRIVTLYEDGLLFRYEPDRDEADDPVAASLQVDQTLKLKFRRPRAVEDHYVEMSGTIVDVSRTHNSDGPSAMFLVRVQFRGHRPEDWHRLRPLLGGDGTTGSEGVFAPPRPRPSGDAGHARPEPPTSADST